MEKLCPTTEVTPILSLPFDLLEVCVADVSKSDYPALSLVCKSFRSLLASMHLYETRSLINRTDSRLYVCLEFPPDRNPHWFTLCGRPNQSLKKKKRKPTGNILVAIPSSSTSVEVDTSSLVVVGSDIYEIGGFINDVPSSRVSVLDCRSNTWREGPKMQVERGIPSASVVDGKIYVLGGRENKGNFCGWIEVFDPKIQTWKVLVSSPGTEVYLDEEIDSFVIDGMLYILDNKGVIVPFNPKDGTCDTIESNMCKGWSLDSYCVIKNVLFYFDDVERLFKWYDTKVREWRILEGLKKLPKFPSYVLVNFVGYGGKMVVIWYEHVHGHGDTMSTKIWCAEIALRRCYEKILGKVLWFDVVLQVPMCCESVSVLAVTVS